MRKNPSDKSTAAEPDVTRRRVLTQLGLAAAAAYTAPVLLKLSEARASGFSGGSIGGSGPVRVRRRRHFSRGSGPSLSDSRQRQSIRTDRVRRRRRIQVGSFSR
jgi:hypothetical protein